jgi:hypothetical protein
MGLIASDDKSGRPADRDRYLLPQEKEELVVRRHPAVLLGPIPAALVGLGAAVAFSSPLKISGVTLLAVWLALVLLLLWMAWKITNWLVDYLVVTSDRILIISGFLARDVAMIPYAQLIDITYERSLTGQFLGYGRYILDLDDEVMPAWKINFVPHPEQLYLQLLPILDPYLPGRADSGIILPQKGRTR